MRQIWHCGLVQSQTIIYVTQAIQATVVLYTLKEVFALFVLGFLQRKQSVFADLALRQMVFGLALCMRASQQNLSIFYLTENLDTVSRVHPYYIPA